MVIRDFGKVNCKIIDQEYFKSVETSMQLILYTIGTIIISTLPLNWNTPQWVNINEKTSKKYRFFIFVNAEM